MGRRYKINYQNWHDMPVLIIIACQAFFENIPIFRVKISINRVEN